MQLYHGSHSNTALIAHIGLCLTDSDRAAEAYACGDVDQVYTVELDLNGLNVVDMDDAYDREENEAPGDRDEDIARMQAEGIDVITYDDEDERGRVHACWRIISDLALSRITESAES